MRPVSIVTTSWDDGDPKDLKIADLLHSSELPGTFYVPMIGYLGRKTLESRDLRELTEQGFEVGGHSVSHQSLPGLTPDQLCHEVGTCKQNLEQVIGQRVIMFCYPNGHYNRQVIQALQNSGYAGARTVRMLSTNANFRPFEMPTSMQAYPHSSATYVRNLAKARNAPGLLNYMKAFRRNESWVELGKRLFRQVLEQGGIWHLYGHSWEIEELNLWSDLREMLEYISHCSGVKYLNNGHLVEKLNLNLPFQTPGQNYPTSALNNVIP